MCSLDDEAPLVWDLGAVTPVGIPWKLLPGGNILGAPSPSTSHSGGGVLHHPQMLISWCSNAYTPKPAFPARLEWPGLHLPSHTGELCTGHISPRAGRWAPRHLSLCTPTSRPDI